MPVAHILRDWQDRLVSGKRLPDDIGEEAGGREIWLSRTYADGGKAQSDAIKETTPTVVCKKQFADCFLRPVAGERRVEVVVRDGLREGRAKDGDRRREDDLGLVVATRLANRLEEIAGTIKIDAVALFEIGLCFSRHDGGEVENQIWTQGHQFLCLARRRQVAHEGVDGEAGSGRRGRQGHVMADEPGDWFPCQLAIRSKTVDQLHADHAAGANYEDLHVATLPVGATIGAFRRGSQERGLHGTDASRFGQI